MSELHLEITEIAAAGFDIFDIEDAYAGALETGATLTRKIIEQFPNGYEKLANAWLEEYEVVA